MIISIIVVDCIDKAAMIRRHRLLAAKLFVTPPLQSSTTQPFTFTITDRPPAVAASPPGRTPTIAESRALDPGPPGIYVE